MTAAFDAPHSAAMHARACRTLAAGVSSGLRRHVTDPPLYFQRADGPRFFDVDGHEFIDYTLAWGPLIAGSNHSEINAAVTAQLSRGYTYGAQHAAEIELAELILSCVPGLEQVIFANSGSEAVQAALRVARAFTGREWVVKFEGHYHGWFNNVLVSYRPRGDDPCAVEPTCGGQPSCEYARTLSLPWNDLSALERLFSQRPGQIAAVITEPILANSGCVMPSPGYLAGLVELCRRHGAVSIFDEVITGFRLALGGARQFFNVQPDLSVYGKAIAGGFALSAVGGRAELFDVLRDGRTIHAGTYNGNAVNLAAAIATLHILRRPGTFERMHAHGQAIRAAIEQAAAAAGRALLTTGVGSVFGVHFGLDQPPIDYRQARRSDGAAYTRFRAAMLRSGVMLLPDGRWYVSAVHTDRELDPVTRAIGPAMASIGRDAP